MFEFGVVGVWGVGDGVGDVEYGGDGEEEDEVVEVEFGGFLFGGWGFIGGGFGGGWVLLFIGGMGFEGVVGDVWGGGEVGVEGVEGVDFLEEG